MGHHNIHTLFHSHIRSHVGLFNLKGCLHFLNVRSYKVIFLHVLFIKSLHRCKLFPLFFNLVVVIMIITTVATRPGSLRRLLQGGHPSWKSWNCPGIFICPGKCPGIHKKGPVSWKLGFFKFLFVLEFF